MNDLSWREMVILLSQIRGREIVCSDKQKSFAGAKPVTHVAQCMTI